MNIIGIIVEYNPMHNGHLHHFTEIKKKYPDSLIIAIMSGYTTERGEISVFDKWTKTRLALEMGVDIVTELPFIYTNNNAEVFSKFSVDYLAYIGVEKIVIGSEANLSNYDAYLNLLESPLYNKDMKDQLKAGNSYKKASLIAMEKNGLKPLLSNDTLGLFYYKRIKEKNYNIKLESIKRESNDYNDKELAESSITSATSIRNNEKSFERYVPDFVFNEYKLNGFLDSNDIFKYLKFELLRNENLDEIALTTEGFYNALKKAATCSSLDDIKLTLTSKRYTTSRVNRIILNTLFDVRQKDLESALNREIDYIRVLGFNYKGQSHLKNIKKDINIYTNVKEGINSILDSELLVSKLLSFIYKKDYFAKEQSRPIIKE